MLIHELGLGLHTTLGLHQPEVPSVDVTDAGWRTVTAGGLPEG
jgi:hypothetical protein